MIERNPGNAGLEVHLEKSIESLIQIFCSTSLSSSSSWDSANAALRSSVVLTSDPSNSGPAALEKVWVESSGPCTPFTWWTKFRVPIWSKTHMIQATTFMPMDRAIETMHEIMCSQSLEAALPATRVVKLCMRKGSREDLRFWTGIVLARGESGEIL